VTVPATHPSPRPTMSTAAVHHQPTPDHQLPAQRLSTAPAWRVEFLPNDALYHWQILNPDGERRGMAAEQVDAQRMAARGARGLPLIAVPRQRRRPSGR
jgi:hypothetical protein